ncbi:DUF3100 domain-containing protein [Brevibacillus nitrificans]|uniref:DUF3100 domain-containing protein n=1 Tax=Brevibacillus nitrificans TaxID=651560 RepID=UPI0026248053|nr:DUF3100 domain-containing protein [Brevibacillus nitrificans]MED1794125.1 DUF3100 domain-containing protein [Brevibacillus nitrificans]
MTEQRVNVFKLHFIVLVLVALTEFIGTKKINIGIGVIALFPMLYALVLGGFISWPKFKWLKEKEMNVAANILGLSFFLFICKLGANIGPELPKLMGSGVSLLFQEVGHIVGTIALGLPIALWLGLKREAIGATYSLDREPNLAIVVEKFGANSAEARGALGVYICGTLFGAIYMSILASLLGSSGLFHPISLAMGAAVGSGSMMAAATGSLAVIFPDAAKDIAFYSGAANLMMSIIGTYVCIFVSLPLTQRLYAWLEPIIGRKSKNSNVGGQKSA